METILALDSVSQTIAGSIHGERWTLCDRNTFGAQSGEISDFLGKAFSVAALELSQVVFQPPGAQRALTLEGRGALQSLGAFHLRMILTEDPDDPSMVKEALACSFVFRFGDEAAAPPMAQGEPLYLYALPSAEQTYRFTATKADLSGSMRGVLAMDTQRFDAEGIFDTNLRCWQMEAASPQTEPLLYSPVLAHLLRALQMDFSIGLLPDVQVTKYTLLASEQCVSGTDFSQIVKFDMETDADIPIVDDLEITRFGLEITGANEYGATDYGDSPPIRWVFLLRGYVALFRGTAEEKEFPVFLQYGRSGFSLYLDLREDKCNAPALSDICKLVGVDCDKLLPHNFLDITLRYFQVQVPGDLSRIDAFHITVSSGEKWSFFENVPGAIILEEIEISLSVVNNATQYGLEATVSGKMSFLNDTVKLVLYAAKPADKDALELGTYLQEGTVVNLNDLACELGKLLLGHEIRLPIPEITIQALEMRFSIPDYSFYGKTSVRVAPAEGNNILGVLLNVEASLEVSSPVTNGVRSLAIDFQGSLLIDSQVFTVQYTYQSDGNLNRLFAGWENTAAISPLSLIGILQAFGVEPPAMLYDFNLGIDKATMAYDFARNVLEIYVRSNQFGSLTVELHNNGKLDYVVVIQLKDKIHLSDLPVVGTHLQLLDALSLEYLSFVVCSMDYTHKVHDQSGGLVKEVVVKSGAAFHGTVRISEKTGADFFIQLYESSKTQLAARGDAGSGSGISITKWFSIDKDVSIFSFKRIGIGYDDGRVKFQLDASLLAAPIAINLLGLGISTDMSNPLDIGFHLAGLGVFYSSSGVSIGGEFANMSTAEKETYIGLLLLKVTGLSVFVTGMYESTKDSYALFAYALLAAPLGGIPEFFVTGLSAGFGYNEELTIPAIEDVIRFPLVAGATGAISEASMATELRKYINMRTGQYFLAAGIRFTTYKILNSFALAIIGFGKRMDIAILGYTDLSVPFDTGAKPIARAQLALKVSFSPSQGVLSIEAQLTSESYILSKECMLTGGFAFYWWFSGEHAGDFVVSLGGYHPTFQNDHYPVVPRVGFKWTCGKYVTISGQAYFALTPSCLMLGARLELLFQMGNLRAWFISVADFYIAWKPLYYEATVRVSLGASYRVDFLFIHKTFSLEISASLRVWGPEFSGEVYINWYIISFTIAFGAHAKKPAMTINWDEFKSSFLPTAASSAMGAENGERPVTNAIHLADGQIDVRKADGREVAVVRPDLLEVTVKSSVPSTTIVCDEHTFQSQADAGILVMGENQRLTARNTIRMEDGQGQAVALVATPLTNSVPGALWGLNKQVNLVEDALMGVSLRPAPPAAYPIFPQNSFIDLAKLMEYQVIARRFSVVRVPDHPANPYSQMRTLEEFSSTVMQDGPVKSRSRLVESCLQAGFPLEVQGGGDLTDLATYADDMFDTEIFLGVIA